MHRCLYLNEVVELVTESLELVLTQEENTRRANSGLSLSRTTKLQSILNLGLTCRALLEPSMSQLWRRMPTVDPLMLLFPSAIVRKDKNGCWWFDSAPDNIGQWDRFPVYAKYVRFVCLDPQNIGIETLHVLATRCPTPYLFPTLRDISWRVDPWEGSFNVAPFLSPALTEVKLLGDWKHSDTTLAHQILEALPTHSRDIQLLNVLLPGFSPSIFSEVAKQLQSLRVVFCNYAELNDDNVGHFAQLSRLQYLQLATNSASVFPKDLDSSPYFPSLKGMILSAMDIHPFMLSLLNFAPMPSMNRLEIGLSTQPVYARLSELYQAVSNHLSLEYFSVEIPASHRIQHDDHVDHFIGDDATIQPLLKLSNLTDIRLARIPLDLSVAAVEAMAKAWPRAVSIQIGQDCDLLTSRIPLEALGWFAEHCKELQYLGFIIDASEDRLDQLSELECQPPKLKNHTALRELVLGESKLGDPRIAAQILGLMFPLARIKIPFWQVSTKWAHVNELLQTNAFT